MESVSVSTHMVGAGGCGGGMEEGYRKILHAVARCAAVTPLHSVTMSSFVSEMGMNKYAYPHTYRQMACVSAELVFVRK